MRKFCNQAGQRPWGIMTENVIKEAYAAYGGYILPKVLYMMIKPWEEVSFVTRALGFAVC